MKRFKHRCEYAVLKAVEGMLCVLPLSWALRVGECLGALMPVVLAKRKRLVRENLARAFPEKASDAIDAIARQTWRNLGRTAVEFVRSHDYLSKTAVRNTTWEGVENMENALKDGRGVVLITSHLTNWEILGMLTQLRFGGVMAIARPMKNPYVEKWVQDKRERGGMKITLHRQAVKASLGWLKAKNILGVLVDQNLYTGGVFAAFFGRPAATTTLPALLHMRTGAAVVITYCLREGNHFHVVYEPALKFPDVANEDQRVLAYTQAINDRLEQIIRQYPANWFWIHNRWKRQPDAVSIQ